MPHAVKKNAPRARPKYPAKPAFTRPNTKKTLRGGSRSPSRPTPNFAQTQVLLLNKPYDVLCQFTDEQGRQTLKDFVPLRDIYAAGRLDRDSEGLLILTNHGEVQHRLSSPQFEKKKTYFVQVDGEISEEALQKLAQGVQLKDGLTRPAIAKRLVTVPAFDWASAPKIRVRQHIPTSWISLTLTEGKNRQVRRMTAAVGFPTLRLVRVQIGEWTLGTLAAGESRLLTEDEKRALFSQLGLATNA